MKYYKRIIEDEINRKLRISGALLLTGPKYCGKTTTAKTLCKTIHSFSTLNDIELYSADIKLALKGEKPILIDEWQNVPLIWDEVRKNIDDNDGNFNQFVFTGSVQLDNYNKVIHGGEGRFSKVIMYPFSLYESKESFGVISVKDLFDDKVKIDKIINNNIDLEDIAYLICRGGWPTSLKVNKDDALEIKESYYSLIFDSKNKENRYFKNSSFARSIVKSYARNISSEANYQTIKNDILNKDNISICDETIVNYLDQLNRLFIIEDLPPWNVNIRSKAVLRTSPVRHFVDTSIAIASLGITPKDLLNDFHSFGLFFEDFVIRDLRVYANANKATLSHYRDSNGLECDAIMHKNNGDWGAFEIKLSGEKHISEGIKNLMKLNDNVLVKPKFLAIIVAKGEPRITKEGIYIIPINTLKN